MKANIFKSREELVNHVINTFGTDIEKNRASEEVIEGTEKYLKYLGLSPRRRVYGIPITATDAKEPKRKERDTLPTELRNNAGHSSKKRSTKKTS